MIKSYLRNLTDEERTPALFMEHCNSPDGLLSKFKDGPTKICYDTLRRWMISLGFKATLATKGWFTDSHVIFGGNATIRETDDHLQRGRHDDIRPASSRRWSIRSRLDHSR